MELPILHKHCVNCFNKHCNITDVVFDQATSCRMVSCNQFACPSRFHECKLQDHLLWCPCKKVPCINQVNGCPWIIPRWKLGVHLEVCPASVIRCSSEWNRWPMHSSDVKSKVSVPLNNPRIRCAQLDVALAMRDQRMLIDSMKVPVKIRNTLRNALTQRFPAVPITNYRASSAESDYAASRETSSTFSDDEAPWNPSKTPPGLQSSVCSKLIKATKQVTVASALDALDDSSTYIHMNSPLSEIIECRENDNSHQNVSKSDLDVCFTDGYNMFSSALVERKGELVSNSDTNIQLQTQQSLSSGVYLPAQVMKHYVSNLTNEEKLVSDPETDSYSTQLEQGVCETNLDYASEGVNDVSKLLCLDKPVYLNEMLGVDLTIESIARYQAKPSSMYTFLCAQDFRRDEYSWHVKNVHDDIHCRLNGWLEQRCPLSCYGCTFSFRHLHPGYSGSEIIHSTLLESYGLKPSLKSGDEGSLSTSTDADIVHLLKQNKLVREITPEISTSYKFDSEIKIQPHYSVLPNSCESTPYLASSNMDILSALPVHVMRNIARCLDGFSLCNLAMTTKFLREICCSLLEERGIVVQIWERCRSVDKVSWVVAYTKWHFSTVFTPVQHWRFAPVNPLSDHLRTCPFNQDKQQWVHPQKLIAMADCTEMFSNTSSPCSVFTEEPKGVLPEFEERLVEHRFQDKTYLEVEVWELLKTLDKTKSHGADGLHRKALAELKDTFAKPLSVIFDNNSRQLGIVPDEWKLAHEIQDSRFKIIYSIIPSCTAEELDDWLTMSVLSVEECELLSDGKYRNYITNVEKALRSFEYTSEWADLISALGKINKVLLNHIKYPVIPKRVTIGKRLAQCLHPALPSGVHLKALETYDIIFKCIGTQRLAADLFIYTAGLFPLMGHAAMSVRPVLLGIYEKHFIHLAKQIKPGLGGLLLGLLPGLEEGSEVYDRTNSLLEVFSDSVDQVYFYTCLWQSILTCPSVRLPAVTYLLAHFNKKKSMDDQIYIMGQNIELLVTTVCTSVQDTSVLVQRCVLDFILYAFPLHAGHLIRDDLGQIIHAAVTVVLRRDMSLNRRLYAWLLGTDTNGVPLPGVSGDVSAKRQRADSTSTISEADTSYFQNYSKEYVVSAVKYYLMDSYSLSGDSTSEASASRRAQSLKPFRMLISLLDKPEIGPIIIEEVLLEVFRCLYRECVCYEYKQNHDDLPMTKSAVLMSLSRMSSPEDRDKRGMKNMTKIKTDKSSNEMIKSANLLFASLEPYFAWDYIAKTFELACQDKHDSNLEQANIGIVELCDLVDFLLDAVSLETYIETTTEHLPDLLHHIIRSITNHCSVVSDEEVTCSLNLCAKILEKVQPSMTILGNEAHDETVSISEKAERKFSASSEADLLVDSENLEINEKISEKKDENEKDVISEAVFHGDNVIGTDKVSKVDDKASPTDTEIDTSSVPAVTPDSAISELTKLDLPDDITPSPLSEMNNEFQMYNSVEIQKSPRVSYKISGPLTLMQASVNSFQNFFHIYVTERVLRNESVARQCIESMTLPTEQIRSWEHDSVIDSDSTCSQEEIIQSDCAVHNRTLFGDVADKAISAECCEAFICACKLLVDFSSFPMYCTDYQRVIDRTRTKDEEVLLPLWLEDLITSSCFNVNFPIQSVAIATILDLIILTQSVQSESESKTSQDSRRQSCNEGTVSVVLLPALLPRHLKFLNENTLFYQTIAQELWSRLAENTPEFHHRSVELFHLLHQVTPNPWICEDVIGRQLVTDQQGTQVEAFKKFCVLWHLTRDKKTEPTPGKTFRTFDRSMFVCLDHLREDTSPSQTIASTWLTHAVQRGDLGRILEPLLLMLLHPDTARVSIQHVNIHKPQNVRLSESGDDADSAEANIYAISSEGGKVIYHVSGHGRQISKKNVEHLRSFAVSVTKDGDSASSVTTAPTRAQMELSFERISAEDVKLRVNPFSSQNSLDTLMFDGVSLPKSKSTPSSLQLPDFSNAKRLTKETCRREGIYFDGHDEETLEKSEQETDDNVCEKIIDESASEISKKIIEGLISNVVNDFDENSCESIDTRTNSEDMNQDPELTSNEQRLTPIGHDRKSLSKSPSDSLLASRKRAALRTLSTSSRDNSMLNDEDLLNGIDRRNVTIDSPIEGDNDTELKFPVGGLTPTSPGVHTLHMHILLYTQRYDYRRTLYALLTFKSLLIKCPRLIVISMATTSITATQTPNIAKLQTLLARHRKSVFGKNYFGDVYPETVTSYRSNMYLEIIVSLCLYYIRSYYPNLMMSKLSGDELNGNKEVHILGTDVLTLLMTELGRITKDSGKNFATYVGDLLKRSKLQKAILHCILASIYNARTARSNSSTSSDVSTTSSVTEAIVDFNEHDLEPVAIETFQKKLLDLLLVIVKLEDHILRASGEADAFMSSSGSVSASSASAIWDRAHVNFMPSLTQVQYNPALPVVQQPMFLSCVLSALKQQHQSHMHRHWIGLVTASLPYLGSGLAQVAIAITAQLCRNLELLSHIYERGQLGSERRSTSHSKHSSIVSPDLIVTMIEGLITVCHYCLLDNSPAQVSIGQHGQPNSGSGADSGTSSNTNFFSLLHVFNTSNTRESSPLHDSSSTNSPVMEARRGLLNILPRIISCLATLWKSVRVSEGMGAATGQPQCVWIMGYPKVIGQHVLEFLSPLSVPHGLNLLAAIAIDWYERRKKNMPHRKKPVIPVPSSDQLLLVDLVGEIKVLPTDKLVQTIKQVLKQPAQTADMLRTKGSNLEVSMLQFFFAYIQDTPPMQLLDSWPSLLSLLKETLQINLSPPSIFLLLEILNEFVQKCPTMDDRKAQKELQDIAQKLLEAVGMIAGSCLEQTTWLRKNFAVKPGPQTDLHDLDDLDGVDENEKVPQPVERKVVVPQNAANADAKYNVQALTLLAERTSCLLDVIYGSDEKEKITPFLTSLMYNVFPYLRSHSSHNLPSFRACSSILASLSGYQYSRKAWRKEALELLLDVSFFQMDVKCVVYWRTVVDNLMTHDKTTFKDLMTRVAITQSGSLNLFTNKEQELEQRSMLLKRLAFTLFCSEPDQYQKNMPDIQERLSESLRLPQMPSIIAQVFLCFRVLVLRMSPHHLTSLWPTIITEMVHIFMQIEQELSTETDEFKTQLQRIAALDASWANLGNGLNAHNNPAWLLLYLGACKLLDQMLAMPADMIPQFQLYRWAFIGSAVDESEDDDEKGMKSSSQNEDARKKRKRLAKPQFVPHVVRITKLMNSKIRRVPAVWTVTPGRPLLNIPVITSLAELHPFFNALCLADNIEPRFISKHTSMLETRVPKIPKASSAPEIDQLSSMTNINNTFHGPSQEKTTLQCIEGILEQDFVEPLNTG